MPHTVHALPLHSVPSSHCGMCTVCGTANALKNDGDEGGGAMGLIVGGAVGAVVLLGGIALVAIIYKKKQKKKLPTTTVTATHSPVTDMTPSIEMNESASGDDNFSPRASGVAARDSQASTPRRSYSDHI